MEGSDVVSGTDQTRTHALDADETAGRVRTYSVRARSLVVVPPGERVLALEGERPTEGHDQRYDTRAGRVDVDGEGTHPSAVSKREAWPVYL